MLPSKVTPHLWDHMRGNMELLHNSRTRQPSGLTYRLGRRTCMRQNLGAPGRLTCMSSTQIDRFCVERTYHMRFGTTYTRTTSPRTKLTSWTPLGPQRMLTPLSKLSGLVGSNPCLNSRAQQWAHAYEGTQRSAVVSERPVAVVRMGLGVTTAPIVRGHAR